MRVYVLAAFFVMLAVGADCRSDRRDDPAGVYSYRAPTPEIGTGRIYHDREIARVRSHDEVAEWLDRPEREVSELSDRLVEALELKPADVVADIGAGTGFYTFRIADRVPHGRVLAVDIQPEMLADIRERADEESIRNVEPILGSEKDPHLPANSVDLALIVGSYPEFYYPFEMMGGIVQSLVPGGRVVLVEYRGEDATIPMPALQRLTEAQARREMNAVGLRWLKTLDVLPRQHLMIYEKPVPDA
jgi:ubiquinone/menaquinone biosynthesis C-methylase UbiE